jgi:hypothetical protein
MKADQHSPVASTISFPMTLHRSSPAPDTGSGSLGKTAATDRRRGFARRSVASAAAGRAWHAARGAGWRTAWRRSRTSCGPDDAARSLGDAGAPQPSRDDLLALESFHVERAILRPASSAAGAGLSPAAGPAPASRDVTPPRSISRDTLGGRREALDRPMAERVDSRASAATR